MYSQLQSGTNDWNALPIGPFVHLRDALLYRYIDLVDAISSVTPPEESGTNGVAGLTLLQTACDFLCWSEVPIGIPNVRTGTLMRGVALVMLWLHKRLRHVSWVDDVASHALWFAVARGATVALMRMGRLTPTEMNAVLVEDQQNNCVQRMVRHMCLFLPHVDGRDASLDTIIIDMYLRSIHALLNVLVHDFTLSRQLNPYISQLCRQCLTHSHPDLRDDVVVSLMYSSMPGPVPLPLPAPVSMQLSLLPPVSTQAILRALRVRALQISPQSSSHLDMQQIVLSMTYTCILEQPPSLEPGWTTHEGGASCLIDSLRVTYACGNNPHASHSHAMLALIMLIDTIKTVDETLGLYDGVPGRRLHKLLTMRHESHVHVMLSRLLRIGSLDERKNMQIDTIIQIGHCLMVTRPSSISDRTRGAYVSLAATLRKILVGLTHTRTGWNTQTLRHACLQALLELPRDDAKDLRLAAILASILTTAAISAQPADLTIERGIAEQLGPMGGVRDVVLGLLTTDAATLSADLHGRVWTRFAVEHCPNMLPGCGNWSCENLAGACEAALPTLLCSGCRRVRYCSDWCQRLAWIRGGHREVCGPASLKK